MTAVLELAQRPALQSVCEATGASFYNEGYFSLKGVDYYPECDRERLTAVAGRLYDYIIMDFGNYADADQILFNKCDVRIIISGSKPWELANLEEVFRSQEEEVLKAMPQLRRAVGDRAVLRALHFYADDRRAVEEADALERRDRDAFLQLVKESGRSSWELLQNITPAGAVEAQDMAIALEAAEIALNGKGACRVHGGGFAGVIMCVVPEEETENYVSYISEFAGKENVYPMNIRAVGAVHIEK